MGPAPESSGSAATYFEGGIVPVMMFQVLAFSGTVVANLTNSEAISLFLLLGETTLPQPASAAKRCLSPRSWAAAHTPIPSPGIGACLPARSRGR